MPLISGFTLSNVVAELCRRNVKLYHACQRKDLGSYLQVGGIPSRNLLASKDLSYTVFDTDPGDQRKGTWKLVFFNLSDFGGYFARGRNSVPNPYGPILLCFDPKVLESANDISVTLWSAGASDFDREADGIPIGDMSRLFTDSSSGHVRFPDKLRNEFDNPRVQSPEVSCSFDDELAPMNHLAYVRVDPYSFDRRCLPDVVRDMVGQHNQSCRVYARDRCDVSRYQILWDAITQSGASSDDVLAAIAEDSRLSTWARNIQSRPGLSFQFKRYARYLRDGTLRECLS